MTIRINALPEATNPAASSFLAVDGATTEKATLQKVVDAGAPVASQAEAEAGADNAKRMTALRTKQYVDAQIGNTIASAASGALANTAVQPGDLGDSATLDVGTTAGTVAAGDDERIVNAETVIGRDLSVSALAYIQGGDTGIEQAINRAIDFVFARASGLGGRVILPNNGAEYEQNGPIVLKSNVKLEGVGKPTLKLISTTEPTIFDLSNCGGSVVTGFKVKGEKATAAAGRAVNMSAAQFCGLTHCDFVDLKGTTNAAIYLDLGAQGNEIEWNTSVDCGSNFIGLIGGGVHGNFVRHNWITDCDGFGIFVAGGAYANELAFNRTESNGIELIGVTALCELNRIIGNHAQGCGDNGISVTGRHNLVVGNTCIGNDLSGIFLYGSFNACTGNLCTNNNQAGGTSAGIAVQAVFGGTGQFNTVVGNTCDDDQAAPTQNNSIRCLAKSYTAWASGVAVAVGDYRFNGLHIYRSATAGTTGASAPVHTSGTVSDGSVDWTYYDSFLTTAETGFNTIGENTNGRSISTAVFFSAAIPQDMQIFSGSSSVSRLLFNDGADDAWLEYNHATRTAAIGAAGASLIEFNASRVGLLKGWAAHRTGAGGSYSILATDHVIGVTSTAAPRTLTLPASGRVAGMTFVIKDESGGAATNNITVQGNGANIDGAASHVINTNYGFVALYWTGAIWAVTAKG